MGGVEVPDGDRPGVAVPHGDSAAVGREDDRIGLDEAAVGVIAEFTRRRVPDGSAPPSVKARRSPLGENARAAPCQARMGGEQAAAGDIPDDDASKGDAGGEPGAIGGEDQPKRVRPARLGQHGRRKLENGGLGVADDWQELKSRIAVQLIHGQLGPVGRRCAAVQCRQVERSSRRDLVRGQVPGHGVKVVRRRPVDGRQFVLSQRRRGPAVDGERQKAVS